MAISTILKTKRDGTLLFEDNAAANSFTVVFEAGDLSIDIPQETIVNTLDRGRLGATPSLRYGDDQPITGSFTAHLRDLSDASYATLEEIVMQSGDVGSNWGSTMGANGEHLITISDGVITKELVFTMESTPPPPPAPLLPTDMSETKSEAYFDWEDVTDLSPPITYNLQVASDENFASIVLEKQGLAKSEYALTEEEKLAAVKEEAPYYWRVKAVDNASNESKWSSPSSFHVGFSFALPGWVVYTLIGLSAIFIGFFAFWVGRRTAYYQNRRGL